MSMDFRHDINGLRGWAVLLVTLYHFGISWLPGGFVGVDVFFVISGYLMTAIIAPQLQSGRFSISRFYIARTRRIVPALLVICAAVLALGWFLVPAAEYKKIASHSAYSLSFTSNIEYWLEAGYFDDLSSEKWLLHTWSLSVEWQFYLLYPLLLVGLHRFGAGKTERGAGLTSFLILAAGASLLATVLSANINTAFYLLHARAWEMLLGGIVFQCSARTDILGARARTALGIAGLALILASAHWLRAGDDWPGLKTLAPTLGAAMVLLANRPGPLLTHPVMQWLGVRSYSIYLWHWPVWVLLGHFFLQDYYWLEGLAASLLLGALSYRWIEQPSTRLFPHAPGKAAAAIGLAGLAVAGSATTVWAMNGHADRFPPDIQAVSAATHQYQQRRGECHPDDGSTSPSCAHGGTGQAVILLGDSHANAIADGLIAAGAPHNAQIIEWTFSGCNFAFNLRISPAKQARIKNHQDCAGFNEWVRKQLETEFPSAPVVIESRYAAEVFGANERKEDRNVPGIYFTKIHPVTTDELIKEYADQLIATACTIARSRKVYLVRPIPEMGFNVPRILSHRMIVGINDDLYIPRADYLKRNQWVWDAQDQAQARCGVGIIDPTAIMCNEDKCFGSINRVPLYHDDDHVGSAGNRIIAPAFAPVFQAP